MSVCLSICPSVRVFTFEVPFKRLFAPTSQSRMSNIFRDSESLGKSNGKTWPQIWTFLFGWFFWFFKKIWFLGILGPPSYGIGATIRIGREMLCLPYAGFLIIVCFHISAIINGYTYLRAVIGWFPCIIFLILLSLLTVKKSFLQHTKTI